MSTLRWKLVAVSFALVSLFQYWRHSSTPSPNQAGSERAAKHGVAGGSGDYRRPRDGSDWTSASGDEGEPEIGEEGTGDQGWGPNGSSEHWAITFLRPKPGENLLDYRDRVLPVAQAAVAPFRAKVRNDLSDFRDQAELSSEQEAQFESARELRSGAIQDRVMEAIFSGEFSGPLKPSSGLGFARSIFDEVEGMHSDVVALLNEEQAEILRSSRFDAIEYLLFSTRWEEMLGVVADN